MGKYSRMVRDELIQELEAWEAKFDHKLEEERENYKAQVIRLERERERLPHTLSEEAANHIIRSLIANIERGTVRWGPVYKFIRMFTNYSDVKKLMKQKEVLIGALGEVKVNEILKDMRRKNG